jgi:hypothetical protein
MVEIATSVATTGDTVEIGTSAGRPRYLLRPPTAVDGSACLELGPDEIRRNFTEIRALIRLDDLAFGIRAGGKLLAVLCRHPAYRPTAVEHYRDMAAKLRGHDVPPVELAGRLSVLEIAVPALAQRLAALEAGSLRSAKEATLSGRSL